MSEKPDAKTDTCEVRWKHSLPAPETLTRHFTELRVGAEVRGVEAAVNGSIEMKGTNFVLRIGSSGELLELGPLTRKVQWDTQRKEPALPSSAELNAFHVLIAQAKLGTNRFHVVGPLVAQDGSSPPRLRLEVRKFEAAK